MDTTFTTSAGTFTTSTITPQDMNAQLGQIAQQANDLVQLGLPSSMTDAYVQNATAGIGDPNSLYNTSGLNVIPSSTCTTCTKVSGFWDNVKSALSGNLGLTVLGGATLVASNGAITAPAINAAKQDIKSISFMRWITVGIGALFLLGGVFMFSSNREISIINEVAKTE